MKEIKTYISWRDILDTKSNSTKIWEMIELAEKLGYEMILWNGWVYGKSGNSPKWIQLHYKYNDIK